LNPGPPVKRFFLGRAFSAGGPPWGALRKKGPGIPQGGLAFPEKKKQKKKKKKKKKRGGGGLIRAREDPFFSLFEKSPTIFFFQRGFFQGFFLWGPRRKKAHRNRPKKPRGFLDGLPPAGFLKIEGFLRGGHSAKKKQGGGGASALDSSGRPFLVEKNGPFFGNFLLSVFARGNTFEARFLEVSPNSVGSGGGGPEGWGNFSGFEAGRVLGV